MIVAIVIIAVVVILAFALMLIYNGLVRKRNRCENAWSQVDVQLRRRYDLVPNIVETVKGYASHERGVFEEVTKARSTAMGTEGVAEKAGAENALTQAIGKLFAVAENYPDLKATENFQQLQATLEDTENKISVARQIYNDAVLIYDNARQTFPTNTVAGAFNFVAREYFEVQETDQARQPVAVKF